MIPKFVFLACLMLTLVGSANLVGQTRAGCGARVGADSPKYRVASKGYTGGKDPVLLLYISVKPDALNRDSMIKLAGRIRNDFCKDARITAVIFDEYRAAKGFVPHPHSRTYEYDMRHMKGGYHLDRSTGEEYISFSPPGGGRKDEDRITLTEDNGSEKN